MAVKPWVFFRKQGRESDQQDQLSEKYFHPEEPFLCEWAFPDFERSLLFQSWIEAVCQGADFQPGKQVLAVAIFSVWKPALIFPAW